MCQHGLIFILCTNQNSSVQLQCIFWHFNHENSFYFKAAGTLEVLSIRKLISVLSILINKAYKINVSKNPNESCQVFFIYLLGKKYYHELNFISMPTVYCSQK